MASSPASPQWLQRLPELAALQDEGVRRLLAQAQTVDLPRGARVFHEGEGCRAYLLVLEGSVRVQKVSESGREIVLYRVESGQDCVLTTSCLLGREPYHAEAVAETEVRAVALPAPAFRRALAESEGFRDFIFREVCPPILPWKPVVHYDWPDKAEAPGLSFSVHGFLDHY